MILLTRAALLLLWSTLALAETGETGDSGESAETGDTAPVDTGELQEAWSLSERTGEEGGCFGSKSALAVPGVALGLLALRRRVRCRS